MPLTEAAGTPGPGSASNDSVCHAIGILEEQPLRSLLRHREHHLVERIGWLRAAVLGANDGIVSTASLVLRLSLKLRCLGTAWAVAFVGVVIWLLLGDARNGHSEVAGLISFIPA